MHSKAKETVDQWLRASGLGAQHLRRFSRPLAKTRRQSRLRHVNRRTIWWLVKSRTKAGGIAKPVCCHSFRATGITEYMNYGGTLDIAQRIAGHAQLSTTKVYDRSKDRVAIAEIERISFDP